MAKWPDKDALFAPAAQGSEVRLSMAEWFSVTRQMLSAMPYAEVTIVDDKITPGAAGVSAAITLNTEGNAPADNLSQIDPANLHDGAVLFLRAAYADRAVTLAHGTELNGIRLAAEKNKRLSVKYPVVLRLNGTHWIEDSAAGDVASGSSAGLVPGGVAANTFLGAQPDGAAPAWRPLASLADTGEGSVLFDAARGFYVPVVTKDAAGSLKAFGAAPGALPYVGDDGAQAWGGKLPVATTLANMQAGKSTQANRLEVVTPELFGGWAQTAGSPSTVIFTANGVYTVPRKCLIRATVIDGGQGGGRGYHDSSSTIGSSGLAGRPGCCVVSTFFCNAGVAIPVSVGAGGSGAAGGSANGVSAAEGAWGGFSSVGDGVNSPLIKTVVGLRGTAYYPFSIPARVSFNGTRLAGSAGTVLYSPLLQSGTPGAGAGAGSYASSAHFGVGGNGGNAGWVPPVLGLAIPTTGAGTTSPSLDGSYGYPGSVSTGFGAGGPGSGIVVRTARGNTGNGGNGAPGLVILEIF